MVYNFNYKKNPFLCGQLVFQECQDHLTGNECLQQMVLCQQVPMSERTKFSFHFTTQKILTQNDQ